jgi:hypothetical protein
VSVPQTTGAPYLHLVDPLTGLDVPVTEKATDPEPDPTDASAWPESNLVDGWHWCVDPHDVASLEAAECERLADLHDAPDAAWHRMMAESIPAISGGAPFEPSPQDWEDYARAFDGIDASDPPANQISPDELAMMAAGLPLG